MLLVASNVGASIPMVEDMPCSPRKMSFKELDLCRQREEEQRKLNRELAIQRQIEQEEKARFEKEQFEKLEAERLENERLESERKKKERLEQVKKVEAQEQEVEELKKLIMELQLKVIELIKQLIERGVIPEIVA